MVSVNASSAQSTTYPIHLNITSPAITYGIAALFNADLNRALVITGPPGIGKTTLALQCARVDLCRQYFYQTIFIPSEIRETVESAITELARDLKVPSGHELTDTIAAIVTKYNKKTFLFILDSLEDCTTVQDILDLHKQRRNIFILATSRSQSMNESSGYGHYNLTSFDEEDSVDLINCTIQQTCNSSNLRQISNLLVKHPLSLKLAASWFKQYTSTNSITEVADLYLRELTELGVDFSNILQMDIKQAALLAVKANVQRVETQTSRNVLHMMSYLNPDRIDVSFFTFYEAEEITDAIEELAAFSLISVEGGVLRINRLIQELVRTVLRDEKPQIEFLTFRIASRYYDSHMNIHWKYMLKYGY